MNELPKMSYAPVSAYRATNPVLLWRNMEFSHEDYASDLYFVPHPGDPAGSYSYKTRTYFADRYGGRGVGSNGGSGRCGVYKGIQIKGLGQTPLIGKHSEYSRAHGGLTLSEAIREAIWGEVCHSSLPFGGVRSLAIATTGTKTFLESNRSSKMATRTLLLREFAIRPAHFMRAINFSPIDGNVLSHLDDVERTRAAVQRFPKVIATMFAELALAAGGSQALHLNDYLIQVIERFAVQIAAARAKRIPHGALNCSNICLDGRFIDFGTMTSVSDYGPVITSIGKRPFGGEHAAILPLVRNLIFYLAKYLTPRQAKELINSEFLHNQCFLPKLENRLRMEFLKLTGFHELAIAATSERTKARLWNSCKCLFSFGDRPFNLSDMPEKIGACKLGSVLKKISLERRADLADQMICEELPIQAIREEFVAAYFDLRDEIAASKAEESVRTELVNAGVRCEKLNSDLSFLYRQTIAREITELLMQGANGSAISQYIDTKIGRAKELLSDAQNDVSV